MHINNNNKKKQQFFSLQIYVGNVIILNDKTIIYYNTNFTQYVH